MFFLVFRKLILIIGWIIFAYVAYKTSQVELDFTEFDPYAELGIDRVSFNQTPV
jgi:preprotein translocase subunit Sec63